MHWPNTLDGNSLFLVHRSLFPPVLITSIHNPRIKEAAKLRERKARLVVGRIIIDGAREIGRAITGGVQLIEAFVCEELCHTAEAAELLTHWSQPAESASFEIHSVTPAVFEKLAFGERAEGIVVIAQTPRTTLMDLTLPETGLVCVLEGLEKPGNVGAVLRSADGSGVVAVIIADGRTDIYNPNAIRASLGTIFTVPICQATSRETLHWLRERDCDIFAARVDGAIEYTQADFHRRAAIVLGSEADGLSDIWYGPDVTSIKLPMCGTADSLNVSATASILFYEALRQRTIEQR